MAAEKQVLLRGMTIAPGLIRDDKVAGEAGIKPGMMLELSGAALVSHNSAGGARVGLYALERDEGGNDLDAAYALGDNVKYMPHISGVTLNLLLAANQEISDGEKLVSNADGTLKAWTNETSDEDVVGYAEEDVASTAAVTRVATRLS